MALVAKREWEGIVTALRGLTISYQPGILMPIFWTCQRGPNRMGEATYHSDGYLGRIREDELGLGKLVLAPPHIGEK